MPLLKAKPFLLAALTLVLAACGARATSVPGETAIPTRVSMAVSSPSPTETVTPTPAVRGEIEVWLAWTPAEMAEFQWVIERFMETHPGVQMRVAYYPESELQEAYAAAVQEGRGPTMVFGPSSWGPGLWEEGVVADVSSRAGEGFESRFNPLAWQQVRYQGALLGMPLEMEGVVLYRNRATSSLPADSVAALVRQAQRLRGEGRVGVMLDFGFRNAASQIVPCDGRLVTPSGEPGFGGQAGLCWLDLLGRLAQAGPVILNGDADLAAFASGDTAWLLESSGRVDFLSEAIGSANLAVDPWPRTGQAASRMAGFVWTENAYLAPRLTPLQQEVAWAFLVYMTGPEAQAYLSDPEGAAHLPVVRPFEPRSRLQAEILAAFDQGTPWPLFPDLPRYITALERTVRLAIVQAGNPEVALQLALDELSPATPEPGG